MGTSSLIVLLSLPFSVGWTSWLTSNEYSGSDGVWLLRLGGKTTVAYSFRFFIFGDKFHVLKPLKKPCGKVHEVSNCGLSLIATRNWGHERPRGPSHPSPASRGWQSQLTSCRQHHESPWARATYPSCFRKPRLTETEIDYMLAVLSCCFTVIHV